MKSCSGFGHRYVYQNINDKLEKEILKAIDMGCYIFYTGAMGEFDRLFASIIRKYKKEYNIKLICVKPYLTKELNENKDYYYTMYDDIIIPDELSDVFYKQAITKRNEWIIDNSDIVIGYAIHDYGGAYQAIKYAKKQNKTIFSI